MTRFAGRHGPFALAFCLGALGGGLAYWRGLEPGFSMLVAVDLFFAATLALMLRRTGQTPETLRRLAAREDAGTGLIVAITLLAVSTSLTATISLLNRADPAGLAETVLALASVPLGWGVMHTLAAFHYAHLFYGRGRAAGGLFFPGNTEATTDDPDVWDFMYFSFGIGMTAQVSDVTVKSAPMRRVVLAQAVAAFLTNTVILALAVNAAVALPQ
ncbi:MAG: DUF1345 domain-containing protein [Pseudomonadota bacterium]